MSYKFCRLPLLLLLALTGCAVGQSPIGKSPLSPEPLNTAPSPTITVRPPTKTPSPTPWAGPPFATPSLEDSPIADNFLFANPPDNCVLPACWQGVTVGVSHQEDVQRVFDEVFGFDGRLNFFSDEVTSRTRNYYLNILAFDLPPGIYATNNNWYYPEFLATQGYLTIGAGPSLNVLFWLDYKTNTVQAIALDWGGDVGTLNSPTPVEIIRNVGIPDVVHIDITYGNEFYEAAGVSTSLIYKSGLIYEYTNAATFNHSSSGGGVTVTACIDKPGNDGRVYLVPPMEDVSAASSGLTPLQKQFLQRIERDPHGTTQSDLGITTEDFVRRVQAGTTCFDRFVLP